MSECLRAHRGARSALQEVEVAAFVGLHDVLGVQADPAALRTRHRAGLPLAARGELVVGHVHRLWPDAAALWASARERGLTTSLDGNFDPVEQWDRGILGVLAHCDVFFANEQELRGITGAADLDAAVARVLGVMPDGGVVVAKLGADGAMAVSHAGAVRATTPQAPGALVDTVGAGDSLAAGYLTGLLGGESIEGCLRLGVACGTASTRGAGGVGAQPGRAAADALAATVQIEPGPRAAG